MKIKICLISDLHISKNNELLFGIVDAEKSLSIITKQITNENPDYIFALGDLSQDGSIESYLKIKEIFRGLPGVKYVIPGNHDSDNIKYLLDEDIRMVDTLDILDHRFIFLDSSKNDGSDEGFIRDSDLKMITRLCSRDKINNLILHHHFIENGGGIDEWILENRREFMKNIAQNKIQNIFHGHVHNGYIREINGLRIYAAPSTCVEFENSKTLKLNFNIGYQRLILSNGSHEYQICSSKNEFIA